MTTKNNARVDTLLGYRDPSMGDERERDVILRANGLAHTLALVFGLLVAVFMAAGGLGWAAILVLLAVCLPVYAAYFYARNEGVDMVVQNGRTSKARRICAVVFGVVACGAVLSAIGYQIIAGEPLLNISWGPNESGDVGEIAGMLIGAVCGAGVILLGMYLLRRKFLKAEKRAADEDPV